MGTAGAAGATAATGAGPSAAADAGQDRTRLLVLFGGRSGEHEISCLSARSVLANLDPQRYEVTTVGITPAGRWTLVDGVPHPPDGRMPAVADEGPTVTLAATCEGPRLLVLADADGGHGGRAADSDRTGLGAARELTPVDVCFPVLHGPYGEDGTVQGLLASVGVPYVGADVASSALGIDKRQMKHVFTAEGLPQTRHRSVRQRHWGSDPEQAIDEVEASLAYPVFVKPARQGSSIGVGRAGERAELGKAIAEALTHDRVAICEQGLDRVRELECGVLGNAELVVSEPGEVVVARGFYDYEAKYLDESLRLQCPADVPEAVAERCQEYARAAYLGIGARGMARVDFFYRELADELLVNEINTIPGFTDVSMFPHVWQQAGLSYAALVDRLVALALDAGRSEARYAP
jgi:D-alanine-D-alanine ligase